MPLKTGRKVSSQEGNFGQHKATGFAKFAGILADEGFIRVSDAGSEIMNSPLGRAKMSRRLARTKAGYKHMGGDTARKIEQAELRKTVEAQNERILELEDKKDDNPKNDQLSEDIEGPINLDENTLIDP